MPVLRAEEAVLLAPGFENDSDSRPVLLTTNSYCGRAWPENTDLLNLTAKVLLDTTSNLKSIQLAFKLV